jgi:hypothetical protein
MDCDIIVIIMHIISYIIFIICLDYNIILLIIVNIIYDIIDII